MKLKSWPPSSIKTRVTFSTLIIFLLSIWMLTFYVNQSIRNNMQQALGEQQFASATYMAAEIDHEFEHRFNILATIAATVTPELLDNLTESQALLERHTSLQNLFNGGAFITNIEGKAGASIPFSSGRTNRHYLDRDYIRIPIENGKHSIGRPVIGKALGTPIFGMAVPIRDRNNKVIGALAGITELSHSSFLDNLHIANNQHLGSYKIASLQHQLLITASDKKRVMQGFEARDFQQFSDEQLAHKKTYEISRDDFGNEALSSIKAIPIPDWYLSITLPTKQAFAPIQLMHQCLIIAAVVLSLFAGGFTWWTLTRQLSPIFTTIKSISSLIENHQPLHTLAIIKNNEIGQLILAFNHLIRKMELRDEALLESKARFKTLTEMSSDFYWESNLEHRFISRTFSKQGNLNTGDQTTNLIGYLLWQIPGLQLAPQVQESFRDTLCKHSAFREIELAPATNANRQIFLSLSGDPVFDSNGKFQGYRGIATDISVRKQAEAELRLAASAFDIQESMLITNAEGSILRVNKAFTKNLGYSADEIIGKKPSYFRSGTHSKEFYAEMWQAIQDTGSWQGEIWDRHKNGEILPYWLIISAVKNAEKQVTHYIGAHYDLTERRHAAERINHLSYFDQLTGLPNRQLLIDRLKQHMASSSRNHSYCALLSIDIDLKGINDLLGHDIGDQLIQQVAGRLNQCVREGDTVARIGGDEFIVMLAGLSTHEAEAATHTEDMAARILSTLNEIYLFESSSHHSTSNIGVSLFRGHQFEVEELLKQVNLAMGRAKEAEKSGVCFFDPAMEIAVIQRAALENDLHTAIAEQQFLLVFQAQFDDNEQINGAEVLVRWQHPKHGMVSPADFIPLAEETGLILPLGEWVLETACQQLAAWQKKAETMHLILAVNVSANQFRQKDFVQQVLNILAKTGANPNHLKLELTESLLVSEVESVIEKMFALKSIGISFSLDDFGTGYSSLSYLKRLPLDQLKIDQSFVRDVLSDPNDAVIIKTIIALGQSLGLSVIAEGVELAEQRDFLLAADCHTFQGYFFSRPLPFNEFELLCKAKCVANE